MAAGIKGIVLDKTTSEPLIGATVQVAGSASLGAITDIDGQFEITGLKAGSVYALEAKYVAYRTHTLQNVKAGGAEITIEMEPDQILLGEVSIVGQARKNTDIALMTTVQQSFVVQSAVSDQQIKRTQDKDASEVIRRVPGISIIEDKFVMVRGLSQRYNNVWINGGAVPSSEADSRAFSFDIIPSSQLDNMMIVKSPAPEYPADFSGGFILINTKDVPNKNSFSISLGGNINDETHFSKFLENKKSGTDFLGFDNGLRSLKGGIDGKLNPIAGEGTVDLLGNGFNNDWTLNKFSPIGDLSLSMNANRFWLFDNGSRFAMMGSLNYSNSYKTFRDMTNCLFGAYDEAHDQSNYLRRSTDDQYNHSVRLGAMFNFTFIPAKGNNRYEFKNIFNQLGRARYTTRSGVNAQSNLEQSAEYYYSSRTTYNGQFTGKHTFLNDKLDWSAGYAFANRNVPDRRRYLLDDALESGVIALSTGNDINREYTLLNEHIFSGNANWTHDFSFGSFSPSLKAGAYTEYRTRDYKTRSFIYNWDTANNTLPSGFRHMDLPTELLVDANYGADKLYMLEEVKMRNNYEGNNTMAAGYVGMNLPFGAFNAYAGVRYEHNRMELISNTRDYEKSPKSMYYTTNDFFPSVNTTYKFNDKHQLRFSYGQSVNRPEFREVSSSVYYDFDLASNVQGNTELKSCYVHNIDFRYEIYPGDGDQISLALFYKRFDDPIEWTYTVTGGTDLTYSYRNADHANTYGVELDIRKNLGFIGLPLLNWSFNGALIHSRVKFSDANYENRPMQGQSPYLVNTGLFYQNYDGDLSLGVLYNRIGKRLIGVGRSVGALGAEDTANIPDSYEMPRNAIDLTLTKKFGEKWEMKAAVRDLLAEKVSFKQFADVTHLDGSKGEVEQVTKEYKSGRNLSLSVSYNF